MDKRKNRIITAVVVILFAAGFGLLMIGSANRPGAGTASLIGGNPHGLPASGSAARVNASSNKLAPDFTLRGLDGTQVSLASYRGEKPVILDFFATWCPNCRRDIPKESALYRKYGGQVEVIGINLQESEGTVRSFSREYDIPFPVVLDPRGRASNLYGVRYTNFHVLVGKDGGIVRVVPGDIREADFKDLLDA